MTAFDVVVIGGGFYGARIALLFAGRGQRVLLVERERQLMSRASLLNQARVHHGYHYPRSILTSQRSQRNYARFIREYRDCVDTSFPHYYAIARGSKVSAAQFVEFCRRIGAPIDAAPERIRRLFQKSRVEAVFSVEECAFDAGKLRRVVEGQLARARVEVRLGAGAKILTTSRQLVANGSGRPVAEGDGTSLPRGSPARVEIEIQNGTRDVLEAGIVINATYSGVNDVLATAAAEEIPLKYEMTELALVEPPAELEGAAVTVMDGAYFSLMPYPARQAFTLSHVRYTPHYQTDSLRVLGSPIRVSSERFAPAPPESHFMHMMLDAARYLPAMRSSRYLDSLWEVKAIMPRSESDDSRPILLRRSEKLPSVVTVLGGKIDSVYDVEERL